MSTPDPGLTASHRMRRVYRLIASRPPLPPAYDIDSRLHREENPCHFLQGGQPRSANARRSRTQAPMSVMSGASRERASSFPRQVASALTRFRDKSRADSLVSTASRERSNSFPRQAASTLTRFHGKPRAHSFVSAASRERSNSFPRQAASTLIRFRGKPRKQPLAFFDVRAGGDSAPGAPLLKGVACDRREVMLAADALPYLCHFLGHHRP
jgi:hypothetical protein